MARIVSIHLRFRPAGRDEGAPRVAGRSGGLPTIHDVARLAGVSVATVSRAFARPGEVRLGTAQRVHEAAAELGYQVKLVTQPPAKRPPQTRVVTLVVGGLFDPYFAAIAHGVQQIARELDYTMQSTATGHSPQEERNALTRLGAADGFVLVGPLVSNDLLRITARTRPVVLVNRMVRGVPSVVADNAAGGRQAVDHLVDTGHSRITYLSPEPTSWAAGVRWRAIRDQAGVRGVGAHRLSCPKSGFGDAIAPVLLANPGSGVIVHSDLMALELIGAVQRAGGDVPDDLSVVGFDDLPVAARSQPTLTTVGAPLTELGVTAGRLLIAMIEGLDRPPAITTLPIQLIVRGSTAAR